MCARVCTASARLQRPSVETRELPARKSTRGIGWHSRERRGCSLVRNELNSSFNLARGEAREASGKTVRLQFRGVLAASALGDSVMAWSGVYVQKLVAGSAAG